MCGGASLDINGVAEKREIKRKYFEDVFNFFNTKNGQEDVSNIDGLLTSRAFLLQAYVHHLLDEESEVHIFFNTIYDTLKNNDVVNTCGFFVLSANNDERDCSLVERVVQDK